MNLSDSKHIAREEAKRNARGVCANPPAAAIARQRASAARSICRVLQLATAAMQDGSVTLEDNSANRWWPCVDRACDELRQVRDCLVNTIDTPPADWWTPLHLLEALGAAMWHAAGIDDKGLADEELMAVLPAILDSLGALEDELGKWANRDDKTLN